VLDDFAATTARVISYLATFAVQPKVVSDPTFAAVDEQRRTALVRALAPRTPGWSDRERTATAALLDVFWGVPTYERMRATWGLEEDELAGAIGWVISLIEAAIDGGERPPTGPTGR
jgi:hypothetical protein